MEPDQIISLVFAAVVAGGTLALAIVTYRYLRLLRNVERDKRSARLHFVRSVIGASIENVNRWHPESENEEMFREKIGGGVPGRFAARLGCLTASGRFPFARE